MKIWAISDLHCKATLLKIPTDVDMVICSGDASLTKDISWNDAEFNGFLMWFSNLPIKHKVFVAGNHDTSVEARMTKPEHFKKMGIIYLENETVTIEGIKIFGSPITPRFGFGWAFNCDRDSIHKYWDLIEEGTDIVVTHGPPFGVLDVAYYGNKPVGCKALYSKVAEIQPTYHIFGHIHEHAGLTETIPEIKTTFVNASVVNLQYKIDNHGHILEIKS